MLSRNPSNGTKPSHHQYRIATPKEPSRTCFERFWFEPARRYAGINVWQDRFAYSTGILTAFLFIAFFTPSSAYGSNAVDSYVTSVFQVLQKHQAALPRLIAPANATANAVMHGGAFYLAGDQGWVAEGDGRAGGLMVVRPLSASKPAVKGDVVWLAYTPRTYTEEEQQARELEGQGCLVIAFGPRLASGAPHFTHWIDSFTPPAADDNLTRMGNIISLWTATGEVTASASRAGKTLAFFQSDSVESSNVRNHMYGILPPPGVWNSLAEKRSLAFHDGFPQMAPIQPGVLSQAYISYVENMLQNIREWDLSSIMSVGQEMSRRAAEGHPALLMLVGHMMPFAVDQNSKLFRYIDIQKQRNEVESQLHQGGYFVFIGYVGVYLDLLREVRQAGATAAWIVSSLPTEVHFSQWGDVVIDQQWRIGDCAVEAPGYDVRILPPSGIAQLFIYETLLRAAGAH